MLFISVNRALFLWFLMIVGLSLPMGGHAQQADTERDHKYSPCSPSKYPDNMTMVVQVNCGSERVLSCEVAVFDVAGECRASTHSRPDADGRVYLTIPGDGDTGELTFRVVCQLGGREYDAVATETVRFQVDDHVGSLSSPFQLHIPVPTAVSPSYWAALKVRAGQGGLHLSCPDRVSVRIAALHGQTKVLSVQGACFVALPVGVYVVAGRKYCVKN